MNYINLLNEINFSTSIFLKKINQEHGFHNDYYVTIVEKRSDPDPDYCIRIVGAL